jgi:hypothetical protein
LSHKEALQYADSLQLSILGLYQIILNRSSGFRVFPDFSVLSKWVHVLFAVSILTQTIPYEAMLALTEEKPKGKQSEATQLSISAVILAIANRIKSTFIGNIPIVLSSFICILIFEYGIYAQSRSPVASFSVIAFECVAAFSGVGLSIGLAGNFENKIYIFFYSTKNP